MGIFIGFECDTCGEKHCDCSYEERTKNSHNVIPDSKSTVYSKTEPKVSEGDIIIRETGQKEIVYVHKINDEGDIIVKYIDGRNDGVEFKWEGPYFKIQTIIGIFN